MRLVSDFITERFRMQVPNELRVLLSIERGAIHKISYGLGTRYFLYAVRSMIFISYE